MSRFSSRHRPSAALKHGALETVLLLKAGVLVALEQLLALLVQAVREAVLPLLALQDSGTVLGVGV